MTRRREREVRAAARWLAESFGPDPEECVALLGDLWPEWTDEERELAEEEVRSVLGGMAMAAGYPATPNGFMGSGRVFLARKFPDTKASDWHMITPASDIARAAQYDRFVLVKFATDAGQIVVVRFEKGGSMAIASREKASPDEAGGLAMARDVDRLVAEVRRRYGRNPTDAQISSVARDEVEEWEQLDAEDRKRALKIVRVLVSGPKLAMAMNTESWARELVNRGREEGMTLKDVLGSLDDMVINREVTAKQAASIASMIRQLWRAGAMASRRLSVRRVVAERGPDYRACARAILDSGATRAEQDEAMRRLPARIEVYRASRAMADRGRVPTDEEILSEAEEVAAEAAQQSGDAAKVYRSVFQQLMREYGSDSYQSIRDLADDIREIVVDQVNAAKPARKGKWA